MRLLSLFLIIPVLLSGCASSSKSVSSSNRILYYQSAELPVNKTNSSPIIPDSVHVTLPTPIAKVTPPYHPIAVRAKVEGNVTVQLLIDSTGLVKKGVVVQTDNEIFNNDCLSSALGWKFSSLLIDGVPHEFVAQLKFGFLIDNSEPQVNIPF